MDLVPTHILTDFTTDMRLARLSERTIEARTSAVERLAIRLTPTRLLDATGDDLARWQRGLSRLAPASVDIYTRHIQAFYRWATRRRLIETDPSLELVRPQIRRGRPHPTPLDDLRAIFACTVGALRVTYALAAFAGLRAMEVAALERHDLHLDDGDAFADVHGKGNKDRRVPLVEPLVRELADYGLPGAGYVITEDKTGQPYNARKLSSDSHNYLRLLGVRTTLHSMRHLFATQTYRSTRDLLMLAELLGHSSVATTQIYAEPDMGAAHVTLRPVADLATGILDPRRRSLRAAS